jgi:exosortase H (IPTLxxWG-CTERM-specific)
MLRFVGKFLLYAVGLFGLYWASEMTHRFRYVNECNSWLCGALLRGIGIHADRSGTSLALPGGGLEIVSECSGIHAFILFAAAVLAFPTTWGARLRGLAAGLPFLFAVNVLRLVSLGVVTVRHAAWMPFFHEYLWQVFFVLLVAIAYLFWIERLVPRERVGGAA